MIGHGFLRGTLHEENSSYSIKAVYYLNRQDAEYSLVVCAGGMLIIVCITSSIFVIVFS